MMTTTTPEDLVARVARAIRPDASPEDRRGGRHACLILAASLGEPGEAATWPTGSPTPASRIDGAQLLDLAIAKMRAFLAEQAEQEAKVPEPAELGAAGAEASTVETKAAAGAAPARPARPAPPPGWTPRPQFRIPLVSPRRR